MPLKLAPRDIIGNFRKDSGNLPDIKNIAGALTDSPIHKTLQSIETKVEGVRSAR